MLNKEELLTLAEELAGTLYGHQKAGRRTTNVDKQAVENLLEKRNAREFIDSLTHIVDADPDNAKCYERIVSELVALSPDKVPLFLTLLRFKYAAVKAKS